MRSTVGHPLGAVVVVRVGHPAVRARRDEPGCLESLTPGRIERLDLGPPAGAC